jgi:hypothetical protein
VDGVLCFVAKKGDSFDRRLLGAQLVASETITALSRGKMSDEIEHGETVAIEGFEPGEAESPAKRKRWGRNRFIALGAAVLLLGGGGVWAYAAYQAPTTVIGMAIGSLFGQQNPAYDVNIDASGSAMGGNTLDVSMQVSSSDVGSDLKAALNIGLSGQPAKANVELVTTKKGDYFVQLSEFDSLLSLRQV